MKRTSGTPLEGAGRRAKVSSQMESERLWCSPDLLARERQRHKNPLCAVRGGESRWNKTDACKLTAKREILQTVWQGLMVVPSQLFYGDYLVGGMFIICNYLVFKNSPESSDTLEKVARNMWSMKL